MDRKPLDGEDQLNPWDSMYVRATLSTRSDKVPVVVWGMPTVPNVDVSPLGGLTGCPVTGDLNTVQQG